VKFYSNKDQAAFFSGAARQLGNTGNTKLAEDISARADFQAMLANREQVGAHFTMQLGDLVDALHSLPDNTIGRGWRLYRNNRSTVDVPAKVPHLQVVLAFTHLSQDAFRDRVAVPLLANSQGTPQSVPVTDHYMKAIFFGVYSDHNAHEVGPGYLRLGTTVRVGQVERGVLAFVPASDRSLASRGRNWEHEPDPVLSHQKLGAFVAIAHPHGLGELETRLAAGTFGRTDYSFSA
jgi:hypothetical protein